MAEQFDPYRKWLGIPEQDQPPNHYRLLGIELFEADTDVISNATDGRMAQIKVFQAGRYSEYSQKLLNEVAAAKVCLLNPAKKADYDARLREKSQAQAQEQMFAPAMPTPEAPPATDLPEFPAASMKTFLPQKKRRSWLMVLGVAAGLTVLLGLLVSQVPPKQEPPPPEPAVELANRTEESPKSPEAKPVEPKKVEPPKAIVAPKPPAKPTAAPKKQVEQPKPVVPQKPVEPTAKPRRQRPIADPFSDSDEPPAKKADDEPKQDRPEPKKSSVPDEDKQRDARAKVHDAFAKDFSQAQSGEEQLKLADALWREAGRTHNEPALEYMLGRMSCEQLALAGQIDRSFDRVEEVAERFDVNVLNAKAELLAGAVTHAARSASRGPSAAQDIIDSALRLADEAMAADDFELVGRLSKLAVSAARATKDPKFVHDTAARAQKYDRLKTRHGAVKNAIDTLSKEPDNPEANLSPSGGGAVGPTATGKRGCRSWPRVRTSLWPIWRGATLRSRASLPSKSRWPTPGWSWPNRTRAWESRPCWPAPFTGTSWPCRGFPDWISERPRIGSTSSR